MTERGARRFKVILAGIAMLSIAMSAMVVHRERAVAAAENRIARQSASIPRGVFEPAVLRPGGGDDPARARILDALYLYRASTGKPEAARLASLDRAARVIEPALATRRHWGEAWAVRAMIDAGRHGEHSEEVRFSLARSYRDLPYLRSAAGWRVRIAFENWALLDSHAQEKVIGEAIWIAQKGDVDRQAIFAIARESDAYQPFTLAWHAFRRPRQH